MLATSYDELCRCIASIMDDGEQGVVRQQTRMQMVAGDNFHRDEADQLVDWNWGQAQEVAAGQLDAWQVGQAQEESDWQQASS